MPQFLTGPYQIKRGATSPPYRVFLTNADKTPVDLSQANYAHFVLRQRGREAPSTPPAPTVDSPMTILQEGSDPDFATNVGWAEYDWQPGDTDVAGIYDAEVALYDANDQVYARIPSGEYLEVQILGSLSPGGGGTPPSNGAVGGITGQIDSASPASLSMSDGTTWPLKLTGSGFLTFDYTNIQILLMSATDTPIGVTVDTSGSPTDTEIDSMPLTPSTMGLALADEGTGYVVVFSASPPGSGNFIEVTNRLPFDFVA